MKIAINTCFGGFGLSEKALKRLTELGLSHDGYISSFDINARSDPRVVQVVEELGDESWGDHAELKIVDIPDDVEWHITEYDGIETVRENHRTW